jgi:DNA-binding response OmpR family regulator
MMDSRPQPTASRARAARDVLIVHPDEGFGATLQGYLEEQGWVVARAADARSARRIWDDLAPRLLVVDLDAQDQDGFLLLDVIATEEGRPPVLALSHDAAVDSLSPDVLRSLGIDMAMSYPLRFATLAVLLESLFDRRWSIPPVSSVEPLFCTREEPQCRAS